MQLRTLHGYVGMLIAPTVLFMALTGALQVYNLHEDHGSYEAPHILETLASIHKDQRLGGHHEDGGDHGGPPPGAKAGPAPGAALAPVVKDGGAGAPAHKHAGPKRPWAIAILKVFFVLVAVGLFSSTCVGIWMALQNRLRKRTHIILLAVGTLIPLALALLAS
jgi:hypothetical protein